MENGNLRRKKFDYKWVVVALCFLMVMICLGFCSSNKSIYLNAITGALGISRGAFSINDSCRFITTAIVNMFFGTLVYRYGTKKLIAAGFISLILSMLIYSFATNIFVFYIGGVLLGLGMSWTTTTMVGSIVNKWCKENKGTIMGAVLAANGLGGAIAAQIISPIIYEEGNPFGYQNAYRLVALILFVVAVIIMIFYRENPKGYVDDGKPQVHKKKPRGEGWVGISFEEYWRQAQITSDPYTKGQLLKKAMDLYKDGVLPSLAGEQWIMPTIAHYSLRYIGVVNQLLAALEKAKDYVCIYEYANIAVQSLPGNLDAQYWLIYSMNRLGNQDIARNQLRAAEQVLTDEDYRELLHRLADKFLTS